MSDFINKSDEQLTNKITLEFLYEEFMGGDFNEIKVYFRTKENGVIQWGSGEVILREGDTVTINSND